jgi:hypothetical protein
MGLQAYLCQAGQPVTGLPDPGGGRFDAAGDLDRLIPAADISLPLLSNVDPYGDVELTQSVIPALSAEIGKLLTLARPGPEHRGLLRLLALAEACAATPGATIMFRGD